MTRLTPEDEKRIRAASTNGWRLLHAEERHLLNEIDALRAEIEKLTKELLDARAEIATFRNASPSLFENEMLLVEVSEGHCYVTNKLRHHKAELVGLYDGYFTLNVQEDASPSLCNCSQCRTLNEKEN